MANKLLASQWLVVALQYGVLLLMCFFLYRVIRIIYHDFAGAGNSPAAARKKTAKLIVVSRGLLVSNNTSFSLDDTVNIGRGEQNEIVINETTVSHEHACISLYRGGYLLSDLNSTNGILHNDKRLDQDVNLRKGDKIQIGSTIFRFEE